MPHGGGRLWLSPGSWCRHQTTAWVAARRTAATAVLVVVLLAAALVGPWLSAPPWAAASAPGEGRLLSDAHTNPDSAAGSLAGTSQPRTTLKSGARVIGTIVEGIPAFLGVKYASAERFGAPRVWEPPRAAVLNAMEHGPVCLQLRGWDLVGDEDCLSLNVYTPPRAPPGAKRAVMVFIHGGNLVAGSGSENNVLPLVREGGVVAVTMEYRLNVFGFFTAPEPGISNFGIRDMIAALQWVQRNIVSFGGDADRVTVFGQSAGARAVMVLYQSPLAKGLFQGAIAQSPGLLIADFTQPVAKAVASMGQRCLNATSCNSSACLRKLPAADLARACYFYLVPGEFLPIAGMYLTGYDGDVMKSPMLAPLCASEEAANADKPLIMGSLIHEWRLFELLMPHLDAAAMVRRFLEEFLPSYAQGNEDMRGCIRSRLLGFYSHASCNSSEVSECSKLGDPALVQLATDLYSMGVFAGAGPGSGKRYRYLLDVEAQRGAIGSAHGCDLCYLFHEKPWEAGDFCGNGSPSVAQERLGRMLREYWTSFAKTGVPRSALGPQWVHVSTGREKLAAGLPMLSVKLDGGSAMRDAHYFSDAAFELLADVQCSRMDARLNRTGCYIGRRGHASS
mmetsp:Transcript_70692/g.210799  ORF Transcript_70692/g.210799 Transcript_70692/m.210799 type:complete len:620 (-) Transcript_70692:126-1985(-)